jgi:hypothetical protein
MFIFIAYQKALVLRAYTEAHGLGVLAWKVLKKEPTPVKIPAWGAVGGRYRAYWVVSE